MSSRFASAAVSAAASADWVAASDSWVWAWDGWSYSRVELPFLAAAGLIGEDHLSPLVAFVDALLRFPGERQVPGDTEQGQEHRGRNG